MAHARFRLVVIATGVVVPLAAIAAVSPLPAAGALLHPTRRTVAMPAPPACEAALFSGEGVLLNGWRCHASAPRRGTLVYLHGIADNHTSAAGTIDRFAATGLDVIAYDSRAHGGSTGEASARASPWRASRDR